MVYFTSIGLLVLVGTVVVAVPTDVTRRGQMTPGSPECVSNLKEKIKNVILITLENRSFDNLLGGQTWPGLDNPYHNGPFCTYRNVTNQHLGKVCTQAKDYDEIADDPGHAIASYNMDLYGTWIPDNEAIQSGRLQPSLDGFVDAHLYYYENTVHNETLLSQQVMNYYTEEQVPVLTAITQNFATMNNWHSGIPGPTCPNRACITSGTSNGIGTNTVAFEAGYHELPQRSIFQQLSETNHTWIDYYAESDSVDATYYNWTVVSGHSGSANIQPVANFYTDAAAGTLPEFTFINPTCCTPDTNSFHPTGLVSQGEIFLKQLYDAARAGPQWENTLFIITFDETGGFFDHVPPPLAPRPDNLTWIETTPVGNYTFDFDRLGGRLPTWIVSPWVDKGHVEKLGTNAAGQVVSYSAESTLRTLGYLWDFEPFNPRVEHAPSFDHLIGTQMQDALPSMPTPSAF